MNEHCADCPWFDDTRRTCYRKPPRFCDVDTAENTSPAQEPAGTVRATPS